MATENDIKGFLIVLKEGTLEDKSFKKQDRVMIKALFALVEIVLTDIHRIADAAEGKDDDRLRS